AAALPSLPSSPPRRSSDLPVGALGHDLQRRSPAAGKPYPDDDVAHRLERRRDQPFDIRHLSGLGNQHQAVLLLLDSGAWEGAGKDRKSTRLNSSHVKISYA